MRSVHMHTLAAGQQPYVNFDKSDNLWLPALFCCDVGCVTTTAMFFAIIDGGAASDFCQTTD